MKIVFNTFNGMLPRPNVGIKPDNCAKVAWNCDLRDGRLRPLKQALSVSSDYPVVNADYSDADDGAAVKTASANQTSTGIDGTLKGVGDLLGGIAAVMRAYPAAGAVPAVPTVTSAVDGGYTFAAATTFDTVPTEYTGSPGENGEGVYGRSGCGRCAAYAAAHPDVAMIDIGNEQYRKTMWDALRTRGYTGNSVALPVVITADGFTQSAK